MTGTDPSDAAEYDRLHYRGREPRVLINRLGIRDLAELEMTERAFSEERADQGYPADADFRSYAGFKAIHRHLFQDVYDWAGQERRYTTSRDTYQAFARPDEIGSQMEDRFAILAEQDFLKGSDQAIFAHGAAAAVNAFNKAHPFLEGNGRVMRTWLRMAAANTGFEIALSAADAGEWNAASRDCFRHGTIVPMRTLLRDRIIDPAQRKTELRTIRRLLEDARVGPGQKDGELSLSWTSENAEQERKRKTLVARHREDAKAIAIEIWSHRDPRAYEAWERGGRKAGPDPKADKRKRGKPLER